MKFLITAIIEFQSRNPHMRGGQAKTAVTRVPMCKTIETEMGAIDEEIHHAIRQGFHEFYQELAKGEPSAEDPKIISHTITKIASL